MIVSQQSIRYLTVGLPNLKNVLEKLVVRDFRILYLCHTQAIIEAFSEFRNCNMTLGGRHDCLLQ